jgi:hypothetical protein
MRPDLIEAALNGDSAWGLDAERRATRVLLIDNVSDAGDQTLGLELIVWQTAIKNWRFDHTAEILPGYV